MNKLTRRDFLKGLGTGAAGIAALGMVGTAASVEEGSALHPGISRDELQESCVVLEPITEFLKSYDYDVVVIGAGSAGMAAAMVANAKGAKTAVLQKQAVAISQGGGFAGLSVDDSTPAGIERFLHYTNEMCNWRADRRLLAAFGRISGEACTFVADKAALGGLAPTHKNPNRYEFIDGEICSTVDYHFGPKPICNLDGVQAMAVQAEREGVAFYYETPAVQLIQEGNRITGVIGRDAEGNYLRFNASRGVILATGDYQNNGSMVAKYCPDVLYFEKKQFQKTGDGHLLGMLAGGIMEPVGHCKMVHDVDSGPMWDEPFLRVNGEGKRFMNEEVTLPYINNTTRLRSKDPGRYYQIFDNDYMDYVAGWNGMGMDQETIKKYIPGAVENPVGVNVGLVNTHCCDTLEELAQVLEIDDVGAFLKTVADYNKLCETGIDTEFGKLPKYMTPIKTPPFWGIRRNLRVSAICSGILTNENAQVVDAQDNPIEGLYAAGNTGGQFYGSTDYPLHLAGLSIGRCYTFGYIAGLHAATGAVEPFYLAQKAQS